MEMDAMLFAGGAGLMAIIWFGFVLWGLKANQFEDMEKLRTKPLEED